MTIGIGVDVVGIERFQQQLTLVRPFNAQASRSVTRMQSVGADLCPFGDSLLRFIAVVGVAGSGASREC